MLFDYLRLLLKFKQAFPLIILLERFDLIVNFIVLLNDRVEVDAFQSKVLHFIELQLFVLLDKILELDHDKIHLLVLVVNSWTLLEGLSSQRKIASQVHHHC